MPEPTDPILPCGVEKVVTRENDVFLLDKATVGHMIDGRMISGWVVNPETGTTTSETVVISMNRVVKHVAMGWRNSDSSLHEIAGLLPYSLNR